MYELLNNPVFFFCFLRRSYADILDVSVIYWKFSSSCPCDVPFLAVSLFSCEKSTVTIVTFPTSRKNGGFGNRPACWGLFFLTCLQPFESTKGRCEQDKKNGMILRGSNSYPKLNQPEPKIRASQQAYRTLPLLIQLPDAKTSGSHFWLEIIRTTSACASRNTKFRVKPCKPRHRKKSERLDLCSLRGFGNTVGLSLLKDLVWLFCCSGLGNPLALGHIGFIV